MNIAEASALAATRDEALLVRARAGDRDAYAQLIEPRVERIVRTARALLNNEEDAHDVTQEAFVAAWTHLAKLRSLERFDAWLHRIVVNRSRDALRRRARSRETGWSALDIADARQDGTLDGVVVLAAFDRLRLRDREILVLHHVHDMRISELARHLGIPEGTAKSRLHAARRAFERALEDEA